MRYFDSGVLVKLYHQEPNSAIAAGHVQGAGHPTALTPLHQVEICSALRLMLGRGEISAVDCQRSLAAFEQARAAGMYVEQVPVWENVFLRTEQLSTAHTSATLCRSLDVMHVAIALESGQMEFCTFDHGKPRWRGWQD